MSEKAITYRPEWLEAIMSFAVGGDRPSDDITKGILSDIARSGLVGYSWGALTVLLADRVGRVWDEYKSMASSSEPQNSDYRLFSDRIRKFSRPPFTVQRLCELLLNPFGMYRTVDKWLFALDKVTAVSIMDEELISSAYNELAYKRMVQYDEAVRSAQEVNMSAQWQMDVIDDTNGENTEASWMKEGMVA